MLTHVIILRLVYRARRCVTVRTQKLKMHKARKKIGITRSLAHRSRDDVISVFARRATDGRTNLRAHIVIKCSPRYRLICEYLMDPIIVVSLWVTPGRMRDSR